MYNREYRDNEYLRSLQDFICEKYHIHATDIIPANRGYYGETWRLKTASGSYFVKLDYSPAHQKMFQNSFAVMEYLCNSGIDFIGRIVKTCDGQLYTVFRSAILGLFEWIDGKNVETDQTKPLEFQMLSKIYPLTKQGFDIPTVDFSNAAAVRVYDAWEKLKHAPQNEAHCAADLILQRHSDTLSYYNMRLLHFAARNQNYNDNLYFTHGDAGGNFFVGNGKQYIVDWDEIAYAPLERDAWVMCARDWTRTLFNETLRANNISYELRPERLAFYCYHMFFFYLGIFLENFELDRIAEYFAPDYFIWERTRFADTVQ